MRIHLTTTPSKETVPFNYQPILTGALHKWIGENTLHDDTSLYSFSWLRGGTAVKRGLVFENGAGFFISAFDNQLLKKLIKGIQDHPVIASGMEVNEVKFSYEPDFKQEEILFYTGSPVLVKRKVDDREQHYTYKSPDASACLTHTLKTKLRRAGLSDEGVSVSFESHYPKAKTKVIYYNKIGNRVNLCPVNVKGSPEQIAFAWNVGVGNSTGIGFGALK